MIKCEKIKLGDTMAVVKMERACGCFKHSKYEMETTFDTIEEALDEANEMCIVMNEDFCHKHKFRAEYVDGEVIIKMEMNG